MVKKQQKPKIIFFSLALQYSFVWFYLFMFYIYFIYFTIYIYNRISTRYQLWSNEEILF